MPAAPTPTDRRDLSLFAVPVLLLLAGAALRFLAYASTGAAPTTAGFANAMCVWDCYWYGDVALHGYQAYPEVLNFGGPAGIANWAFFPLYPLLVAAIGRLGAIPPPLIGAVLSPLLTLGAVLASWPLFAGDRRAYFLFGALLLAGPFSFYFATLYSESLFLVVTVVAFVQLERRRYGAAGLAGALLSATRTVGVLFVFAILTEALRDLAARPAGTRLRRVLERPDMLLGLMLGPAGIFAFMVALYLRTGDALAFVHIQRAWDREMGNPATLLWTALVAPEGQVRDAPLLGLSSVVGLVLCAVLAAQRRYTMAVFCTLALVLSLASGVESMLRFVAALAPLGIALSVLLARWRPLFWLSLVAFAVLDYELTLGWLGQRGALM